EDRVVDDGRDQEVESLLAVLELLGAGSLLRQVGVDLEDGKRFALEVDLKTPATAYDDRAPVLAALDDHSVPSALGSQLGLDLLQRDRILRPKQLRRVVADRLGACPPI